MAIVITRLKCVQGAKYDGCGGWGLGVRRQKRSLNRNERDIRENEIEKKKKKNSPKLTQ